MPSALTLITDNEPTREQMPMGTMIKVAPCVGATFHARWADARTTNRAYARKVGREASAASSATPLTRLSSGALRTIVTLPTMQRRHPSQPNRFRRSLRTWCASTALTMMLSAPSGVTRMAGAKAYAAKLAASPTIIVHMPVHHRGSRR